MNYPRVAPGAASLRAAGATVGIIGYPWDSTCISRPGDGVVTIPWLGALICFDLEFPEPARAIAGLGAGLLAVCDGNMDP